MFTDVCICTSRKRGFHMSLIVGCMDDVGIKYKERWIE